MILDDLSKFSLITFFKVLPVTLVTGLVFTPPLRSTKAIQLYPIDRTA